MNEAVQSPESLEIRFDDGARVTALRFVSATPSAQVLLLPALGTPASYYAPLAEALAAQGLATITVDHRGLGGSSVQIRRGVDFGYRRLVDDTAQTLATIRARWPGRLYLFGHSLGGHVGALLSGLTPQGLSGLVLCACGTPWYRLYRGAYSAGIYAYSHLADLSSRVLGYYPGQALRFAGTEAAQLMQEWSRLARSGRFRIAGLDGDATLAQVRLPALSISLAHDAMTPRRSVDHFAAKLGAAQLTRVHLDESRAPRSSLDHFRWVREPTTVVGVVRDWLAAAPRPG